MKRKKPRVVAIQARAILLAFSQIDRIRYYRNALYFTRLPTRDRRRYVT